MLDVKWQLQDPQHTPTISNPTKFGVGQMIPNLNLGAVEETKQLNSKGSSTSEASSTTTAKGRVLRMASKREMQPTMVPRTNLAARSQSDRCN